MTGSYVCLRLILRFVDLSALTNGLRLGLLRYSVLHVMYITKSIRGLIVWTGLCIVVEPGDPCLGFVGYGGKRIRAIRLGMDMVGTIKGEGFIHSFHGVLGR